MTTRILQLPGALVALAACAGVVVLVVLSRSQGSAGDRDLIAARVPMHRPAAELPASGAWPATGGPQQQNNLSGPQLARPAAESSSQAPAPTSTSAPAPAPALAMRKKGAAIWDQAGITQSVADSGAGWAYNWGPDLYGVKLPATVEYVPMIWGSRWTDDATLTTAAHNGTELLGFNEPDHTDQANLTVMQALDLWPRLEATGLRLGSPAVAGGADRDGGWLDEFMTGAQQRGYRVDFIAVHWYGTDFVNATADTNALRNYLDAVYAKYHKPIWLTEFALLKFSGSDRLPPPAVATDFLTQATAMMDEMSFVERYAWFALSAPKDGTDGTGLYRPGGGLTESGKAYRAVGD